MTAASGLAFANAIEGSCAISEEAQKTKKARRPSTVFRREVLFDMVSAFELEKTFA